MNNPISTYRLQFHKNFTFSDLEKVIAYLKKLGVGTIYASPIFESVPGSTHGYDGTNPQTIDPEIGTEEELLQLSSKLKEHNINWLQDIVPNHLAFHPKNFWLMDVLEKGKQSEYASYFDIDWNHQEYSGKLLVPFLGAPLDDVLKNELTIEFNGNRFVFKYYEAEFPLNARTYEEILSAAPTNLQDISQLKLQLENIHQVESAKIVAQQWNEFLLQLTSLMKNADVNEFITGSLQTLNADKARLKEIADTQFYQLAHWQTTDRKINFRRFFTVNGLICLNIQDEQVFEQFHQYIEFLQQQGVFQGLRIDHIDGLLDPGEYLSRLRKLVGEDSYLIVEKILGIDEKLPTTWPIQGNSGYDFLAIVNNLFTDESSEKQFTKFYKKLTDDKRSIKEQIHDKKAFILDQHMAGELENLCQLFQELKLAGADEVDKESLKGAIAEFLIQCPIYRYYGEGFPLTETEAESLEKIFNRIKERKPDLKSAAVLLKEVFLVNPEKKGEDYKRKALKFYKRCMQFTGPLMAKGVEDTLMYTYNRFIGHNEVGDSPENFGIKPDKFHDLMVDRQANWPLSINATSTHDTKRGEDVRARLNVLTELGEDWIETLEQWRFLNQDLVKQYDLDANDEYFIYQTLIGALPMPGQDDADFEPRIHEYLTKALREAKQHSNWSTPNLEYENSVKSFASALLDKEKPFYRILQKFNCKIADFGMINSLSQVVLKFTCPGVPDVYQGCELWDLSLVDPDNRRPVDYETRLKSLGESQSRDLLKLWETRAEGQIKLWLTHRLIHARGQHADFFAQADYITLKVKGKYKEHILAFARRFQNQWLLTVVPLHLAKLSKLQKRELLKLKWKDTCVILPNDVPAEFADLLNQTREKAEDGKIFVSDIFKKLPLAVLRIEQPSNNRGAGILLHITSLPSNFGIGDLGPQARQFADYLNAGGQKYWQLLPLNPTENGQGYSPYSAISSLAGNTLLISPEGLVEDGLLDRKLLKEHAIKGKSKVDYAAASKIKNRLFDEAYHNFNTNTSGTLHLLFQEFCQEESDWLNDYALYVALKQHHLGKPWYDWSLEYKMKSEGAVNQFISENGGILDKIKWLQFIFFKQWNELKSYCSKQNIKLFGDLPFYVSNDSSDVWANKEIFCLDLDGKMTNVAGVPPDYFNDNGQLWGMPLFKWDVLKERNHDWWLKRIKKNLQMYDLLRLDHFRAFSTYWDVPATEETARNGEWKPGPGSDFFKVLKQEFGELPFVAEDLGDVDQAVYDLRDEFGLPGMRVLQFSFGDDQAQSVHSLHNYNLNSVVYTGTHDNNTSQGWYGHDATKQIKKNLREYAGAKSKKKKIHLELGKLAYSSVAKIVILPMQDVIGLDEDARMNMPASIEKNWVWRLRPDQLKEKYSNRLRKWAEVFNRL
ncbi:MAG TPA: malto-oligosyltrehalose synthase [Pedobacter sp.]